jgi:hypothetical protein
VLAPLFTLWDGVSMLSMSRLHGFLLGLPPLFIAWRLLRRGLRPHTPFRPRHELKVLAVTLALLVGFIAAGILWHRPMVALEGELRSEALVDFHSHTNASHDVRGTLMRGFDARDNIAWHRRAGFDAVFITDHNTTAGLIDERTEPVLCPGREVSAWRAHIVLLGGTVDSVRGPYRRDWAGLLGLLHDADTLYRSHSVASIPEYERYHWGRLDSLAAAGLDGFEIVNASPKANELSRARRDSVIDLARRRGLFVVGVSDHHGWGATSMTWSLVDVPGWRDNPDRLCSGILAALGQGFPAVRVVERHRLRPDDWWPKWLTPVGVVWETWRGMGWALTAAWLLVVWGLWAGWRLAGQRSG